MATSRREFIQIGGAGLGAAALGSGLTTKWWGLDPDVVHDPGTDGDQVVPTLLRALLLEVRRPRPREGRPGHQAHRQPGAPALARQALPARHRRHRPPLRPRPAEEAAPPADREARATRTSRRSPGTRPSTSRPRSCCKIRRRVRPRGGRPLLPRLRRVVLQAPPQRLRLGQRRRRRPTRQCRGPREVGFNLTFGAGARLARGPRHRERPRHHAHRHPPRREHAQHPGAGLRADALAKGGRARRRRPALLDGRRQGALLAADQAGHRHRAPPRLDPRHPRARGSTTATTSRSTPSASTS